MSPRVGRPKAENPMNHDIKVRFHEEMNQKIVAYAKEHGITRTEAIRRGVNLLLAGEK